jgi:hypothetical protein
MILRSFRNLLLHFKELLEKSTPRMRAVDNQPLNQAPGDLGPAI